MFNVGDVVVYLANGNKEIWDECREVDGVVGVIICTCPWKASAYGVDFISSLGEGYDSNDLHSLDGKLKTCTGYWVGVKKLAHANPAKLYELEEML
jgi:hypothetical protein